MEETARVRAGQPDVDQDEQAVDQDEEAVRATEVGTAPPPPGGESGPDGQPIGSDNIRDGTVRGSMGGPNQTQGEGQGG